MNFTLNSQEISLHEQFNGRYDFTAIGNTLNLVENNSSTNCTILTGSSANLELEPTQNITAAYLYWAGSGAGDFSVNLNASIITPDRTFSFTYSSKLFFAGFKDVTQIVQSQGIGSYELTNLDEIDISEAYCSTGTNFAGWAIVVIYQDNNLPLNQVNVYDGLQAVPEAISIQLDNLNVVDVVGSKIGFIAWEGDSSLAVNESLKMNNVLLSNPPLNPETNAFNGTNSFTGESNLFNMDIDVYNIENTISTGDTSALIQLTSGQDLVMVNNIVTVLNSQLPDATIILSEQVQSTCSSREIEINYTVSNFESTSEIPSGTPISFYIDNSLVGQSQTNQNISINGQETGSVNIYVDPIYDQNFEITAFVDDTGDGLGILTEINENNNSYFLELNNIFSNLNPGYDCPINPSQGLSPNGDGINDVFHIEGLYNIYINHTLKIYNRYGTIVFKGNNSNKWNGTSNTGTGSGLLPVGTYYYLIELKNQKNDIVNGWVYLNY
ncbi:gliding motility-associated C-terminal domain-containing protein [Flavobacteriaceae bacterium]|nr:gliding motility-associated C-terminal domain-containing protein [Flavobacteriaceae bacterium]